MVACGPCMGNLEFKMGGWRIRGAAVGPGSLGREVRPWTSI